MNAAQPGQGLELMLYGMGMVVAFLVVLVFATRLMTYITQRFFPEPPEPAGRPSPAPAGRAAAQLLSDRPGAAALTETPDPRLLAAVTAAVHAHRRRPRA